MSIQLTLRPGNTSRSHHAAQLGVGGDDHIDRSNLAAVVSTRALLLFLGIEG